jgi:hypothetical protein
VTQSSAIASNGSFLTKLTHELITQEWNLFDKAISSKGGLIYPGTKFNEAVITNSHYSTKVI